jgi:predicted HNH restriction endonuclease
MRNPNWHRDEIILALDLYFSRERGSIDDKNSKIIELSKTLNDLPLFPDRPDEEKFRNPYGVTLKLSNFLAFDPDYKGMAAFKMSSKTTLDDLSLVCSNWHRMLHRGIDNLSVENLKMKIRYS